MEKANKRSKRQWEAYIELNVDKIDGNTLIKDMTADGYTEQEVKEIIGRYRQKSMGVNIGLTIGGALLCILALALTQSSYDSASGGGTYYAFWGVGLVGIVLFIMGLFRLFKGFLSK